MGNGGIQMNKMIIGALMMVAIASMAQAVVDQGFCATSEECSDGIECIC
jgi:cytochrome b